MPTPNDFVIVRQLTDNGRDRVIVCPRHQAIGKFKAKPTGRVVANADEYLQGTPEQIEAFLKEHHGPE